MVLNSRNILVSVLLFLVCIFTYYHSLSYDFVFDDISLVVDNPYIKNPSCIGKIFQKDLWDFAYEADKPNYYRPLQTLSFMLDYRLWRLNSFGYHLTSVFIHFLNALLFFLFIYLIWENFFISVISSILFCIHPINTSAVAYISGRADLLASFFILSTFLSTILFFKYQINKTLYFCLSIFLSISALLSKENALIIPPGILFLSFFVEGKNKDKIKLFLASILTVVLYLYFRVKILNIPIARPALLSINFPLKTVNFLYLIASYIVLLIAPVNLYLSHAVSPIISVSDIRFWAALCFFAVVLSLWYLKRRNKALNFSILWFFIFASPVSFIMTGFGYKLNMAENWVYLASLGFYMIVGNMFYFLRRYLKSAVYLFISTVFLIYIVLTVINNYNFKDRISLAQRILRFNYENKEAHKELADAYLKEKDYDKASEHLSKAIRLAPLDPDLYLLQGIYYEDTGNIGMAIASYERLLKIIPNSSRANNNLGEIYFKKGDFNKAELFFKRAIEFSPLLFEPYLNMAKLYAKNNEINRALSFYKQAMELNPDNSEPFVNLAKIYFNKGDFKSAEDVLNRALTSGHREETVLVLLGIVNGELGFNTKADYYFKEVLRLGPKSEEAMLNIGVFYANQGQFNKAIEIWQEALNKNPDNKVIRENIDKARELLRKRR